MSDEEVAEIRDRLVLTFQPSTSRTMRLAFDELLQRRKEGGSPEEFVMRMAKDVRPEARADLLHSLGEIQRHTMMVREFMRGLESVALDGKTAEMLARRVSTIQCDGGGMSADGGVVKTHEPHPISTPCPVGSP